MKTSNTSQNIEHQALTASPWLLDCFQVWKRNGNQLKHIHTDVAVLTFIDAFNSRISYILCATCSNISPLWTSTGTGQHQNKHAPIMPKRSFHYKMECRMNGNHFTQNISSL